MNGKIKSTKQLGDGFQTDNGTLYTFGVTLEDGSRGVVNAKSTEPWYAAPGTDVVIEDKGTKTKNGTPKWAIKRPDSGNFSGGGAPKGRAAPKDNKGMELGMCMNKAVDILCATEFRENGLNPDIIEDMVFDTASKIYGASQRLRAFANGEQPIAKSEQQEDF